MESIQTTVVADTPVTDMETTDLKLVQEMSTEATLRLLRAQWSRIGHTETYWIEVPCDAATFEEIKREARKQIKLEDARATRLAGIAAARAKLMEVPGC